MSSTPPLTPTPAAAAAVPAATTTTTTSGAGTAATGSERVPVEVVKGINGLDKIVLREVRGSSAEVIGLTLLRNFVLFFVYFCKKFKTHFCVSGFVIFFCLIK